MWYKNVGLRQNASSVKTLKATTRGRFYPSIVYVKEMWVYINYRRVCGYTHYTRYLLDHFKLIMTPPTPGYLYSYQQDFRNFRERFFKIKLAFTLNLNKILYIAMVLSIRLLQVIKISKFIDHQLSFTLINLALKHFHMEKKHLQRSAPPLKIHWFGKE